MTRAQPQLNNLFDKVRARHLNCKTQECASASLSINIGPISV